MKNTPKKIYLNLGEITTNNADELDFEIDLNEITWSKSRIGDHDLPFISQTALTDIIKKTFCEAMETTEKRSQADQNIIGNLLTVIESELKNRIKNI